jgi:hypothetical protein
MSRPFVPFEVFLKDRRRVVVTHPESISIYFRGLGFWYVRPSGQVEFIQGDAVTSIRTLGEADPSEFIVD